MSAIEVNSDNIMDRIKKGDFLISREKYKAIKKYDHKALDRFIALLSIEVYKQGVKDAEETLQKEAMQIEEQKAQEDEVKIDFEDVLSVISKVKGIGQKRIEAIEKARMEKFG